MKKNFRAILFDLDGTLIDTEPAAAKAVVECFLNWGVTLEPADATFVTGRTWESALTFLFSKYQRDFTDPALSFNEATKIIMQKYREFLETEVLAVAGAITAVKALSQNYPLAVVSGSARRDIDWALAKLGISGCFQFILGAEDYQKGKPDPMPYQLASDKFGLSPQEILIFEDSLAGISSAKAAGCSVVAISSTNHFDQDLSLADQTVIDLKNITPEWVSELALHLLNKA